MRRYSILLSVLFIFLSALKTYATINDTIVRCKVTRGTSVDNIIFRIEHNATDNFDGAYDANKMFSTNTAQPQLWIVTPLNEQVAMNSFPFYTTYKSFRIGFKTTIADSITFVAYDFSRIDTNIRFYLRDSIANKLIDLRKDTLYRFYSAAVNNANRFRFIIVGESIYAGGTLNYGLPDSLVALRVHEGTMTISSMNLIAYNVNIDPNASLTLDANSSLNVKNYFKINSNASGTGSFIQNGSLILNNPAIVEKYLGDVTNAGWYLSIPVLSSGLDVFNGADGIWSFNANDGQWLKLSSGTLLPTNGYVTKFSGSNKTILFSGTLNNNVMPVNLIRSGDYSHNFGWNLIGNSYPSAIDYDLIPLSDKVNLNNAIYFRKLDGDVATYNDGHGLNGGSSIIPAMQAFWMQVEITKTSGSLSISNACRLHSNNQQYKKTDAKSNDALKISISDGNNTDETAITIYFQDYQ